MTLGYEAAMRSLEEIDRGGGMRPAEAIQITRLHFEADKAIGATNEAKDEDAWTKEDDRESAETIQKD
jgi:hypothetical protein